MGKNLEQVLGYLGPALSVAGKLIFGPEANFNLGEPLQLISSSLTKKRQEKDLQDVIAQLSGEVPEAKPIIDHLTGIANKPGGLLGSLQGPASPMGPDMTGGTGNANASQILSSPAQSVQSNLPAALSGLSGPSQGGSIFNNDAAIAKIIQARPDLGPDLLGRKISGDSRDNSLGDILKVLGIQKGINDINSYESPTERRQAKVEDRQENMKFQADLARENREAGIKAQRAPWSGKESEDIGAIEQVQGQFASLPSDLKSSQADALKYRALKSTPLVGDAAASKVYPELSQLDKLVTDANAQLAFARGGKNLTGMEAKLTLGTLPSLTENPALYPQIKQAAESRVQLAKLARISAMQKAGRDVSEYPVEQYKEWQQAVNSGIPVEKLQQSPSFQKATQDLGLQGLFLTLKKKQ